MTQERRQRRSEDPLVALHFQLSHVRHEASLDTVVVADGAGLVVAGSGSWAACEELAAFAPLIAQGEPIGSYRTESMRKRVKVRTVDVGGERLLLCTRANEELNVTDEAALQRTAKGISRILAA